MRDLHLIRRYELIFVGCTAVLYAIRRLVSEVTRFDDMVENAERNGVQASVIWRNLASYDHTLNNNVPFIAGICLFLGAWYVFNQLAYPLIDDRTDDRKAGLYLGLTVLLLLTSAFIYHVLKLQVRYQRNTFDHIIGLKVVSLYRKRTVLADAIGLGVFLITYQLFFQFFNYLHRLLAAELPERQQVIGYLPFGGLIGTMLSLAVGITLPPTLFQGGCRDLILVLGLSIQLLALQAYIYTYILQAPRTQKDLLFVNIGLVLFMAFIATAILWGAATNFYYRPFDPIIPFSIIVLMGAFSIAYIRKVRNKEKVVLQTQVSTKSAELSNLRAQINPHFLFNTLNSLYATALKENSEKTADGIQKLGDMMRFMLQENNHDRIPLDKEIEYLQNYIQIQRMRIDETHPIEIRVNIQEPNRPIYIAPMMLTPFVENAFKHGISLRQPSWIYITLTLDDTRLYFKVHNSRHPKTANDPEVDQSGVGLDNVRKRLDLIYPGRHQLDSQQSDQDYFVSLTLVYW